MTTVTLYTKPDCPLCAKAERALRRLAPPDVVIEAIDITQDEALYARYWAQIPVIALPDGTELFAPIDEGELQAALRRSHQRP